MFIHFPIFSPNSSCDTWVEPNAEGMNDQSGCWELGDAMIFVFFLPSLRAFASTGVPSFNVQNCQIGLRRFASIIAKK